MGTCASTGSGADREADIEARRKNRELEKHLDKQFHEESQVQKVLLLGAGESGKSTLFKQMTLLYGKKFSVEERLSYVNTIHNNVIGSAKTLVEQSDHLADTLGEPTRISPDLQAAKNEVINCKPSAPLTEELVACIAQIWQDPGVKRTYELRAKYQLTDSTEYFMQRLGDLAKPDYIPSEQDVLRSRVRTTGIIENEFFIESNHFKMIDVGGQRNERKKWIHCFSDVTAVIFVAAINEYDMMLFEDAETLRMSESLNLFEEIVNSPHLKSCAMILFLNKRDLFEDKLKKIPLEDYFPAFQGGADYSAACEFMRELFLERNKVPHKLIYTQVTCATDTNHVGTVFGAVKDIIIRKSLAETGLV